MQNKSSVTRRLAERMVTACVFGAFMCGAGWAQTDATQQSLGWNNTNATQHVDRRDAPEHHSWDQELVAHRSSSVAEGPVKVSVNFAEPVSKYFPWVTGMRFSMYDAGAITPQIVPALRAVGVTTMRYPGGSVADLYHWSNNKVVQIAGRDAVYAAPNADFGNFLQLLSHAPATALVVVNYGSNLRGDGGGVAQEAAAWVAYANGDVNSTQLIGKDVTGFDWKSVGFWASLRAAAPLSEDDGYNFLRIAHPESFHIAYWQVGDRVFANGYSSEKFKNGGENADLHAAYAATGAESERQRSKHAELSPAAYGRNYLAFAKAMRAVDASIKVGGALANPSDRSAWAIEWNEQVIKTAGAEMDFVAVEWLAGAALPPDWKNLDESELLYSASYAPREIVASLYEQFKMNSKKKDKIPFITISSLGVQPWLKNNTPISTGLFALNAYMGLVRYGAINVNWSDLREQFLSKENQPQEAFYGMQLAHVAQGVGDMQVGAKSSNTLLHAYAVKKSNGSLALLLINCDPKNAATVKAQLDGAAVAPVAQRYDYSTPRKAGDYPIQMTPYDKAANVMEISVPPYSSTLLVMNAKK